MNRRSSLILGTLVLVLLLSNALACGCVERKSEWKTYENKEWKFKFKYPADWKMMELRGILGVPEGVFCVRIGSNYDPIIGGFVSVDKHLFSSCEEGIKDYLSRHSYKVQEWENIPLGGEPAIKVAYATSDTQKVMDICAVHKNKKYEIHLVSDKLDQRAGQINQIVESFEFI